MKLFDVVTRLLLPTFNELQILVWVTILLVLPVNGQIVSFAATGTVLTLEGTELQAVISVTAVLLIIASFIKAIYSKRLLNSAWKGIASLIFYIGFAFCAYSAFIRLPSNYSDLSILDTVNYSLVKVLLLIALVRGGIVAFAYRLKIRSLQQRIEARMKNEQYNTVQLTIAVVVAISAVYLLHFQYSDPATLAVLSYVYANGVIQAIKRGIAFTLNLSQT